MGLSKGKKRVLWGVVRAVIGVALAIFIVWKLLSSAEVDLPRQFMHSNPWLILLGFLGTGTGILITVCRWQALLHAQGIRLPFWDVWRLGMIGQFFSLAIPGAVGGDLVKMGYISRHLPGQGAEAIMTIVLDRILGLLGLLLLAAILALVYLPWILQAGPWIQLTTVVVCGGSIGGIIALGLAAAHEWVETLPGARHMISLGQRWLPEKVTSIVARMVKAFDTCRNNRGALLRALGLALLTHFCLGTSYLLFSHAPRGAAALPVGKAFLGIQVANGISGIPITPAGIGQRDLVLFKFFEQLGSDPETAAFVAVLPSMSFVIWGLVGAAIFIFSRFGPRDLEGVLDDTALDDSVLDPDSAAADDQ